MRPFYQTPYYSIPAPIRPMNPSFFQGNPFGNQFARIPQNIPLPQQGIPGGIPGNIAGGIPAAPAAPFKLDQFMNQAGQFMQSAQKYAPLIQQARPMLNNLPVLWKLYKGFQSSPSQEEPVARSSRSQERAEPTRSSRSSTRSTLNLETRPSLPKIYQPNLENFQ